ncbi:MAG: hypothetical protein F6K30_28790, partial [Cyanothece sp. SIO2G6]|nr:hypothetical protein [Cyanothece sp. SIO2G6]
MTKYRYDAGGNLVRVIDPSQQETVMVYDAVSRLESRTLPNGVTTTYVYQDQTDWIESITHTAADGTVLSSLTYEREPGGEPTKITREDGSYRTFVYDTSLRL